METLLPTVSSPHETKSADLTAADAVWIATAMLHERAPQAIGFSPATIRDEVLKNHLTETGATTIYQHAVQHLVATKPKDPNNRKMLSDAGSGLRRLFIPGDPVHPSKQNGPSLPRAENLPPDLLPWLEWYETWSRDVAARHPLAPATDPMEVLEGTWTFGDADAYLREMREGWEGRP